MLPTLIDAFGVTLGLLSIVVVGMQVRKTGGQVHRILVFFCVGVALQTLALLLSLLVSRLHLFSAASEFDLHHLLMVAGLMIFVGVARGLLPFLRKS